jgi:hypothetical protein
MMTHLFRLLLLTFFLPQLFTSCTQNSLDGYREEGQGIIRSIIEVLKPIHTREELVNSAPQLKRLFNNLTDILILAHEFRTKHPDAEVHGLTIDDHTLSDELRDELNRILRIDGGREILEKSQVEALNRLDTYHSKGNK